MQDLEFIAKGLTSLLMNPLKQTYLPYSIKKIYFSQELYIIFWKMFELNHKFLVHMLRSSSLFDLVVPLLYQLLQTRTNPGEWMLEALTQVGGVHMWDSAFAPPPFLTALMGILLWWASFPALCIDCAPPPFLTALMGILLWWASFPALCIDCAPPPFLTALVGILPCSMH